ncbi:(deoxy)nucleoside triphosphate pyrophosphohydrolase [Leifsonia sp. YIM 134122]|uniref:8-oxo-dGTP diphosphatase n=1 Tax=Leifsonia stereocauli TaxID=3134136 RepID=A0ABU9W7A8_9MICO
MMAAKQLLLRLGRWTLSSALGRAGSPTRRARQCTYRQSTTRGRRASARPPAIRTAWANTCGSIQKTCSATPRWVQDSQEARKVQPQQPRKMPRDPRLILERGWQRVKRHFTVVGAVIVDSGRVLCAQRGGDGSLAGLWEFPGGKVEVDETPRQALEREIAEELGCQVKVGERVTTTTHEYGFGIVSLTTFYCTVVTGSPQLTEHAAVTWLPPTELHRLVWAPADVPAMRLVSAGLA